ncbi:MAG: HNH endonuclease signature motif containing protein [Ignavibacteria bacterium]
MAVYTPRFINGILIKTVLLFLLILILFPKDSFEQRISRVYRHSYTSKSNYGYKAPKSYKTHTSSFYKTGGTKYKYGKTYKSTGLPMVERSAAERRKFLKSMGYRKVPGGYDVDHIVPLSKGGQDIPSNMQLLSKEVHKQKTKSERKKH